MKKILAVLVALCIFLVKVPVNAGTWGTYGDLRCEIQENGTVSIVGCDRKVTSVSIPSQIDGKPVTEIRTRAFQDCKDLSKITIPSSVSEIGDYAFYGCEKLTSAGPIGGGYNYEFGWETKIPDYAFETLPLIDISIPDTIKEIGMAACGGCHELKSVMIPGSVKSIGDFAFNNCSELLNVNFSSGVERIAMSAFDGCSSLSSIIIPDSVTEIGREAFGRCGNLGSVFIPNSVTKIYPFAFLDCYKLQVFYSGSEREWCEIEYDVDFTHKNFWDPLFYRGSHFHFNAHPEDMPGYEPGDTPVTSSYKVYCNNSEETFDVSLEECMAKTSASTYNPQLAHMLIAMCNSVHNVQDMENTFDSFGFEQTEVSHVVDSGDIILGYGLAKKQLGSLGNEKTLVVITCRGTVNALEWVSNVDAAANNKHQHSGFSDAADALYKQVVDFVGTNDFSNVQFVITGHSRGAAAANILAARLVDESQSSNKIYAYTFACPDTAVITEGTAAQYPNIFNINNVNDPISWIPGSIWTKSGEKDGHGVNSHWNKYGKSYWFCEAWDDYKAVLEMPTSIPSLVGMAGRFGTIHPQNIYLDYLRKEWVLSSRAYKNRSETLTAIENANAKRAQGVRENNIKNIYGVLTPESVTMLPEVTVFCPVDVVVYDSAGQMVGQVTNNVIGNVAENKVYICVSDEHKYIYLLDDDKYTIHLCGNDAGTMSYSVQNVDVKTYEITGQQAFKQVELFSGKEFISDVEVGGSAVETQKVKLYVAADNLPEKEVLPDGNGTEVPVISGETWSNPFRDVAEGSWYYDAVRFAYQNSLMSGTSANTFAPNTRLSRAMLAQILYNKEGKPQGIDGKDFPDVAAGTWYANAVKWAGAQGIVAGYGDGRFGPEDDITREQLATMLWRYDGSQQVADTQLDFHDADEISSYAKTAMQWAVKNGVIGGKGNKVLDPKGFATRAEVAQILKNYLS